MRCQAMKDEIQNTRNEIAKISETSLEESLTKHKEKYDIPRNQDLLIKECLRACKCKSPNGNRYNSEWLLLCLLLHIKSPTTYNFLRTNKILPLPAHSTVRKYMSQIDVGCGFDKEFFKLLQNKFKMVSERVKHGILIFDEMQVRQSLNVNSKTFTFERCATTGIDAGNENFSDLADHALVFMFRSLGDNFVQSVGVFANKGPTKGRIIAQLVLQAIILIENAGGYIDGIVCDGATTNRKMWQELGISGKLNSKDSYFFHNPANPSRKVYVFSDAPHLFKCIRNTLKDRRELKVNGQYVRWVDYKNLYKLDQSNPGHLRVCPKLTADHINPSNCLKMRVFLATQIFSKSVADGLQFYQNRGLNNCEGTINFTLKLNYLFDALNRNYFGVGIKLGNTKDLDILRESLNWLQLWEEDVQKNRIEAKKFLTSSTAEGLRVTIQSTIALTEYLLTMDGAFDYVLTAKMNQDCLEQFFGMIRQAGCQNDHPDLQTFLHLYKMLSIYKLLQPPKFGNCKIQNNERKPLISMDEIQSIFRTRKCSSHIYLEQIKAKLDNIIETTDLQCDEVLDHDYNLAVSLDCIIYYITGFICKKMKRFTKCCVCLAYFKTDESHSNVPAEGELVHIKSRGGLIHPKRTIYMLLRETEKYFIEAIETRRCQILDMTINRIINNYKFQFPCEEHKAEIISKCLFHYTTMRMRQYAKAENRTLKNSHKIKKKLSKFYNS